MKGGLCCLGVAVAQVRLRQTVKQHGLLFPYRFLSCSSSLGAVGLLALDLCFSMSRAKDTVSPLLENILKKQAVYYQARLSVMLDWFCS